MFKTEKIGNGTVTGKLMLYQSFFFFAEHYAHSILPKE
jgi:hypothetical protein